MQCVPRRGQWLKKLLASNGGAGDELAHGLLPQPLSSVKTKPNMIEDKDQIISDFRIHDKDTGSSEVQIALLSARINHLTEHLRTHRKDFHSRRGLIALTVRRRKLLDYLKRTEVDKYNDVIKRLKLRK